MYNKLRNSAEAGQPWSISQVALEKISLVTITSVAANNRQHFEISEYFFT